MLCNPRNIDWQLSLEELGVWARGSGSQLPENVDDLLDELIVDEAAVEDVRTILDSSTVPNNVRDTIVNKIDQIRSEFQTD